MENNIKHFISRQGLKNTFIAEQLGCHHTDISAWIGGYKKPNNERLKKLAKILKCKQVDLYPSLRFTRVGKIKEQTMSEEMYSLLYIIETFFDIGFKGAIIIFMYLYIRRMK